MEQLRTLGGRIMISLAKECLRQADRAHHHASTASDEEFKAYCLLSASRWTELAVLWLGGRPLKRGEYVRLHSSGVDTVHPVTGVNQHADAELTMRDLGISSAPVMRWNGRQWRYTDKTVHAAAEPCPVHDAEDPIPGRTCGRPMPCKEHTHRHDHPHQ